MRTTHSPDGSLSPASSTSRRTFLSTVGVAGVGAAVASSARIARSAQSGGDTIRVGLIGCGGRGSGAAADALQADKNVALVAMGDAFGDRLQKSLDGIRKAAGDKVQVTPERCFTGFDAYKKVIDSDVDVVLLCTPPHFRPQHLKAAVEAGKHVFCEKPVAVDAPGRAQRAGDVRRGQAEEPEHRLRPVLALRPGEARDDEADSRRGDRRHRGDPCELSHRHALAPRPQAGVERHGVPGAQLAVLHVAVGRSQRRAARPQPGQGGLGTAATSRRSRASASAGRQVRIEPQWGNIYDHFAVTYEYENGAKVFSYCRQMAGCENDTNDHIIGTKGSAQAMRARYLRPRRAKAGGTAAARPTCTSRSTTSCSPRSAPAKPINNGLYMAQSTMLAIMGRMAAYTGQRVTWEQAMNSQERLGPDRYEWGPAPEPVVAVPGVTKLA